MSCWVMKEHLQKLEATGYNVFDKSHTNLIYLHTVLIRIKAELNYTQGLKIYAG